MKKNKILLMMAVAGICLITIGVFLEMRIQASKPTKPLESTEISSDSPRAIIVAFGDSLTAGYGLALADSYPAQLEQKLRSEGYAVAVRNAGISGETSRGNRERAQFIRSQNPDVVLLGIGGNDALRNLPLEDLRKNMSETIEILASGTSSPKVLLLQMQAPENAGIAYKQSFDSLYAELAEKYNLQLVPFLTERVFRDQSLLLPDGIHPNKEGYRILVQEYIMPALRPVVRQVVDSKN